MLKMSLEAFAQESLRRIKEGNEKVAELELLQQELSDKAVEAITRKKDKAERLKAEKQELLQQLAQISTSPRLDADSSAVSSPPRPPPQQSVGGPAVNGNGVTALSIS